MSIQKLSVRLVLALLALDALCCVIGILSGERNAMPASLGCTLATVVGAGIILLMGRLGAREAWRLFSLTAIGFVLGELLLLLALVVNESSSSVGQRGWATDEAIAQLAGFGLTLALPALLAMRLWKLPNFRVSSRIIVISDCFALFLAVGAAAAGYGTTSEALWPTAFILLVISLMVGLAFGRGGTVQPISLAIRIVSVIAGVAALYLGASGSIHRGSNFSQWFWVAAAIAFCLGHLNAMCLCPLARSERWARWTAVLFMATAATLICVANWNPVIDYQNPAAIARMEAQERWAGGVTIIAGVATLGVFILSLRGMLQKPVQVRTASYTSLAITCPHCQKQLTLPTPSARCPECEMQFELRVIEPRCDGCDYLLLMYKGEQCPECGKPITRPPGPVEESSAESAGAPDALGTLPPGGAVVSLS